MTVGEAARSALRPSGSVHADGTDRTILNEGRDRNPGDTACYPTSNPTSLKRCSTKAEVRRHAEWSLAEEATNLTEAHCQRTVLFANSLPASARWIKQVLRSIWWEMKRQQGIKPYAIILTVSKFSCNTRTANYHDSRYDWSWKIGGRPRRKQLTNPSLTTHGTTNRVPGRGNS